MHDIKINPGNRAAGPAAAGRRGARITQPVFAVLGLVLAAQWVGLVARFQVNTLAWDQWHFFRPLFEDAGWIDVFRIQHGPHRQGIGFVLTRPILEWSAWDARIESLWIVALLVVVAGLVMRVWRGLTGGLRLADAWLLIAALAPIQYENVISTPNASHGVVPWLLLLVSALGWMHVPPQLRGALTGVFAVLLTFTGFGVFAGAGWTIVLAVDAWSRGRRQGGRAAIGSGIGLMVALAGWGWFLSGYVFNPASEGYGFPHLPLLDYGRFVALLFAMRYGFGEASAAAYLVGGLTAAAVLAGWAWATVAWWRAPSNSAVVVKWLFLGTALGFAGFAAVGRVHLGVEAGLASRYTVLPLSAWVGLAAWAGRWRHGRVLAVGLGWLMALGPGLRVAGEKGDAGWAEVGLPQRERQWLESTLHQKVAWLSALAETGDWRVAEQRVPRALHPDPAAAGFDRLLPWLEERRLSFYRAPLLEGAWLPWSLAEDGLWLEAAGGPGDRWMGAAARVWLRAETEGFLNLRLTRSLLDDTAGEAPVEVEVGGRRVRLPWKQLRDGLSLPVKRGPHLVVLRSPRGAVPIAPPRDRRWASFFIGEASCSGVPLFSRWVWCGGASPKQEEGTLRPVSTLKIEDGFWGWEDQGRFGWARARMTLRIAAHEPAYLNLWIEGRFAGVEAGEVVATIAGERVALRQSEAGWQLSWPVPPDGRSRQVVIEHLGGERSPQDCGLSADTRSLALCVKVMGIAAEPAFAAVEAMR